MTGQDAVTIATEFGSALGLDGVILTKMDGDERGGAALSIRAVSGAPIKYVGVGENLDALEVFHPERMASRILGMGDVLTLVEKAVQFLSGNMPRNVLDIGTGSGNIAISLTRYLPFCRIVALDITVQYMQLSYCQNR